MNDINYELIRSSRKTFSVQIKPGMHVVVRVPRRAKKTDILAFLERNRAWIEKQLAEESVCMQNDLPPLTDEEINALADAAVKTLPPRVAAIAAQLGVTYNRITVRNQSSRWGSCSGRKNLNFNCILMLCPEEVMDYVILHELCHLKEMNHSADFWSLVEQYDPSYRKKEKWLKNEGEQIIRRLKDYDRGRGRADLEE